MSLNESAGGRHILCRQLSETGRQLISLNAPGASDRIFADDLEPRLGKQGKMS